MEYRVVNAETGYPVFMSGRITASFANPEEAAAFLKIRKTERPEQKLKVMPFVPEAERRAWRKREATRTVDGTYKAFELPWAETNIWHYATGRTTPLLMPVSSITDPKGLVRYYHGDSIADIFGIAKDHFVHVAKDGAMLAYTESEEKGAADIQTVLSPGRYLQRYFSSVWSSSTIEEFARQWTLNLTPTEVVFLRDPKEIAAAYRTGPSSCMAAATERYMPFTGYSKEVHPTEVYGTPGNISLAVIKDPNRKGRIIARCTVIESAKQYNAAFYGDSRRLERALKKLGYKESIGLPGGIINMIPLRRDGRADPFKGDPIAMAYIDHANYAVVVPGTKTMRLVQDIHERGLAYAPARSQHGASNLHRS